MYTRVVLAILFIFYLPLADQWDVSIENYFYTIGKAEGTLFYQGPILDFIFDWTVVPAEIVGFSALLGFIASYFSLRLKEWRSTLLYLALVMAVGAGLLVHAVFKDHWGRPRPRQTILFEGNQEYRSFYSSNILNQPEPSKSFPCGHASMGFYFFAVAMALRHHGYRKRAKRMFLFAFALGTLLGVTRMAQGGHYLSDVIATAAIIWAVSRLFEPVLAFHPDRLAFPRRPQDVLP